ncbi:hypothetical protein [Labilithrix luteola]|uniref:hypothetical protein n=1 Tax=Labilithrix luteola TaxID=1391654 RepID=UPI0011BA5D9E|nr:hypothetical protein [Labilithrix luteola]
MTRAGKEVRGSRVSLLVLGAAFVGVAGCTTLLGLDLDDKHLASERASALDASVDSPDPSVDIGSFTIEQQLPDGTPLTAIWGADAEHVFAVGMSGLVYTYDTGLWSKYGGDEVGRDFNAVWGRSARDVYAVGSTTTGKGFIRHYDGKDWADVFAAPVGLYGVWGTPDGFVLAVGAKGSLFAWHQGTDWTSFGPLDPKPGVPLGASDPLLTAISGRNFDDFAIAGDARIYHAETTTGGDQTFATYDAEFEPELSFRTVWQAPGPSTNLFFGTNFFGIVSLTTYGATPDSSTGNDVRFKAATILRDETAAGAKSKFIRGIWSTPEVLLAVGDEGRIYALDVGQARVERVACPSAAALTGIWGSSLEDIWVVGDGELILHGSVAR